MKKILILLSIIYSFSFGNWLSLGEYDYDSESQAVYYSSDSAIAGFQFEVITLDGASVYDAFGGAAEYAGFSVIILGGGSGVVGFSLSGASIPVGEGVLIELLFGGVYGGGMLLDNIVISDSSGNVLPFSYNSDFNCDYYDCAGVCEGDAVVDECGTCDDNPFNNCIQDCSGIWGGSLVEDCAGVCGGSAIEDECGVCGGDADGSDCNNDGIDDVCEDEYNLGIDIGAISGDATGDGVLTVNDLIFYIDVILNGNN